MLAPMLKRVIGGTVSRYSAMLEQAATQAGSLRLVIRNMPANKPVGITRELTK